MASYVFISCLLVVTMRGNNESRSETLLSNGLEESEWKRWLGLQHHARANLMLPVHVSPTSLHDGFNFAEKIIYFPSRVRESMPLSTDGAEASVLATTTFFSISILSIVSRRYLNAISNKPFAVQA
jgi:hypothetical protein